MVYQQLVKAWFNKSDEDFSFASSLIYESPYYSQICFHNRYYIDTLYPVHWPTKYDKEKALKAQEAVENIRNAIKAALGIY